MSKLINFIALLTITLSFWCAGCGLLEQTADANKLVVEANGLIVQDNQQAISANIQLQELLGTGLSDTEDLAKYKRENQAALDELAAKFTRIEQNEALITEKFRQASQYKLNEKYKQYLDLKTQEFAKQTETAKLVNPLIASFREAQDTAQVIARLDEFDVKYESLRREIVDLQAQSDQIAKANPTLIK